MLERYPTVTCDFRFRFPQLLHVVRRQMHSYWPIWRTHISSSRFYYTVRPFTPRRKLFIESAPSVFRSICPEKYICPLYNQVIHVNTSPLNKFMEFGMDIGRLTNWLSEDLLFASTVRAFHFMILSGSQLSPDSTWWTTNFTFKRSMTSDNHSLILWDTAERNRTER